MKENAHSCFSDGKIVLVNFNGTAQVCKHTTWLCSVPGAVFPGLVRVNQRLDKENTCVSDG